MSTFKFRHAASALALSAVLGAPAFAQEDLPDPGLITLNEEGGSTARGASADGLVVVGQAGEAAILWTPDGGVQIIVETGLAHGVSADGSVIVGETPGANGRASAFLWTEADGVQSLGYLAGDGTGALDEAKALDVSDDGSVVIGHSNAGAETDFNFRAFRWTEAGGMVSLGTLDDGDNTASFAYGVSGDGLVVVGSSNTAEDRGQTAFRWTEAGGMVSLGRLNDGNVSEAFDVSEDGSVIVGQAANGAANNSLRAFRWTEETGLVVLEGAGSATLIRANAVSGDGSVIVGIANSGGGGENGGQRAFRWTEETAGQIVEDWLRDAGATIETNVTREAYGVSDDGTIVVGETEDGQIFIARSTAEPTGGGDGGNGGGDGGGDGGDGGDGGGGDGGDGGGDPEPETPEPGLITLDDLAESLGGAGALNQGIGRSFDLILNGAGSRPLDRQAAPGSTLLWASGDLGRDDHGARDADFSIAELGIGRNFGGLQLNAVLGVDSVERTGLLGASSDADAVHVKLEALTRLTGGEGEGLWLIATAAAVRGEASLERRYVINGGGVDASFGETDITAESLRLRLQRENWAAGLSPYVDLSHGRTCLEAYAETGGAFPASFNETCRSGTDLRLGADAAWPVASGVELIATGEAVHRFDADADPVSGTVTGLGPFSFAGPGDEVTWARGGLGLAFGLGGSELSVMLNGTTEGAAPSAWLAADWRLRF